MPDRLAGGHLHGGVPTCTHVCVCAYVCSTTIACWRDIHTFRRRTVSRSGWWRARTSPWSCTQVRCVTAPREAAQTPPPLRLHPCASACAHAPTPQNAHESVCMRAQPMLYPRPAPSTACTRTQHHPPHLVTLRTQQHPPHLVTPLTPCCAVLWTCQAACTHVTMLRGSGGSTAGCGAICVVVSYEGLFSGQALQPATHPHTSMAWPVTCTLSCTLST